MKYRTLTSGGLWQIKPLFFSAQTWLYRQYVLIMHPYDCCIIYMWDGSVVTTSTYKSVCKFFVAWKWIVQKLHFNLQMTVAVTCTTCVNIKVHCTVPKQRIYTLLMILPISSVYLPPYRIKQLIFIMEFVNICCEAGTKF